MPYWNIDRNKTKETDYLMNQEYFRLDLGDNNFKEFSGYFDKSSGRGISYNC